MLSIPIPIITNLPSFLLSSFSLRVSCVFSSIFRGFRYNGGGAKKNWATLVTVMIKFGLRTVSSVATLPGTPPLFAQECTVCDSALLPLVRESERSGACKRKRAIIEYWCANKKVQEISISCTRYV